MCVGVAALSFYAMMSFIPIISSLLVLIYVKNLTKDLQAFNWKSIDPNESTHKSLALNITIQKHLHNINFRRLIALERSAIKYKIDSIELIVRVKCKCTHIR